MGLIWVLAASSVLATLWQGAGPSVPILLASAGALVFIPTQDISVAVVALFIVPTLAALVGALLHRAHPFQALMFATADLMLVGALLLSHRQTTEWVLPGPGSWGRGTALIALAAILRSAVGLVPVGRRHMGVAMTGSWMGIVLAFWAGPAALLLLVIGAAVLLASSLLPTERTIGTAMTHAGAVALGLAGVGAPPEVLAVVGAGGAATVLGSPLLGIFSWGLLPLSAASFLSIPSGLGATLVLVTTPLLLGFAVEHTMSVRNPHRGGRLVGSAAVAAAILMADQSQRASILLVGVIAIIAARYLMDRGTPKAPWVELDNSVVAYPRLVIASGFMVFASAAGILAFMAIEGFSTRFL